MEPDVASQEGTTPVPELVALTGLLIQARCDQGLTQEALAQRLHMGLEQLQAFEAADPERLPEPVFVIAQARRLGDALGVDVSEQIQALRRCSSFAAAAPPLRTEVFQQAAQPSAVLPSSTDPSPSNRGTPGVASLLAWLMLLAGAGAGGWVLWQRLPLPSPPAATQAAAPTPPAAQAPLAEPAPPAAPAPDLGTAPPDAADTDLVLNATAPCWLEIRPIAGGPPLFRGTLRGEKRIPLGQGVRLRAGRPDLLLVAQAGQQPRALGTISEVRWVTFRPAGARPLAGSAAERQP
jgi:cytoskeletal protein RodZ